MLKQRMTECAAMMMIGDGALGLIDAKRHMQLWEKGPRFWQVMMRPFVEKPTMTRWFGAAELLAGIWLAKRQQPESRNA
jgi:hypothetical protein